MSGKTIKVPPTPGPTAVLCYLTPPLDGSKGNPMLHCDRRKGHTGRHTWELDAPAPGPSPRNVQTTLAILEALEREIEKLPIGAAREGLEEFKRNLAQWLTMPTEVGTIGEAWASYAAAVLDPIDAGAVQREETKRAFYGGAAATFGAMLKAAELDEDPAAERVAALDRELVDYLRMFKSREGL